MNWDKLLFNRFLIAIPELNLSKDFIEFGLKSKLIGEEEAAQYRILQARARKVNRYYDKISERTAMQRIMFLMPEILSVKTVNFLRKAGLINISTANVLRGSLAASKLLNPVFTKEATLLARIEAVYGAATSNHWINLIRDLDDQKIIGLREALRGSDKRLSAVHAARIRSEMEDSIRRAQRYRSAFSAADLLIDTAKTAAVQRTVWGALTVSLEGVFSDKMLKNALRAKVIPGSTYDLIVQLDALGVRTGRYGKLVRLSEADRKFYRRQGKGTPNRMVTPDTFELLSATNKAALSVWRRGVAAFEYESWAARSLLISEGLLSPEMITFLTKAGLLDRRLAAVINPIATLARDAGRRALENYMTSRRFRVLNMNSASAGMSPIQIFAKQTKRTDAEILKILQAASRDAQKAAEAAAKSAKIGAKITAAQQRLIVDSVNVKMRDLWETVGHLTIFGEKEAARAALDSMDFLTKNLYGNQTPEQIRSVQMQARAGVDAFISREENILPLSKRVYGNLNLAQGKVQLEIQKALIRGLSAEDLAKNVAHLIDPNTPGGISYAAKRLARTEINNAFHNTQIRYTREMPWVDGYKWNLSKSHPRGTNCVCADMASRDHDGIGRGCYKKANVPGKPHPQCLCYLTNVVKDNADFERQLRRGSYDQYLAASSKQAFEAPHSSATTVREGAMDGFANAAQQISKLLAVKAGIDFLI